MVCDTLPAVTNALSQTGSLSYEPDLHPALDEPLEGLLCDDNLARVKRYGSLASVSAAATRQRHPRWRRFREVWLESARLSFACPPGYRRATETGL